MRIHLEPACEDFPIDETPAGMRVVVPRLDVHSMLVTKFDAAAVR